MKKIVAIFITVVVAYTAVLSGVPSYAYGAYECTDENIFRVEDAYIGDVNRKIINTGNPEIIPEIKDVKTEYAVSPYSVVKDEILLINGNGRPVQLEMYLETSGKWMMMKTYSSSGDSGESDISIVFPSNWKNSSESLWRFAVYDNDGKMLCMSETITIKSIFKTSVSGIMYKRSISAGSGSLKDTISVYGAFGRKVYLQQYDSASAKWINRK